MPDIPRAAIELLQGILLFLFAWLLFFFFGNVQKGEKRRLLQNLVYRGYQLLNWLEAVWTGFDTGVGAYYQKRASVSIRPKNEKSFPMEKAGGDALPSEPQEVISAFRG